MLKAQVPVKSLLHSLLSDLRQILDKWKGLHLGAQRKYQNPLMECGRTEAMSSPDEGFLTSQTQRAQTQQGRPLFHQFRIVICVCIQHF